MPARRLPTPAIAVGIGSIHCRRWRMEIRKWGVLFNLTPLSTNFCVNSKRKWSSNCNWSNTVCHFRFPLSTLFVVTFLIYVELFNFVYKFNKSLRLPVVSTCRQFKIAPIKPFTIYERQAYRKKLVPSKRSVQIWSFSSLCWKSDSWHFCDLPSYYI